MKDEFQIEITPAFIFYRNGKELTRLGNLNETNPKYDETTDNDEYSADEKEIQNVIMNLCGYPSV